MELIDISLYELYAELFKKYENEIDEYFGNNAKKLYKLVDKVIKKLNFHDVDMGEYYSLSHEIFLYSLKDYDSSQSFYKFMYSCLYKKFCSNMTMDNRDKRKNKVKVEKKDENGNITIEKIEVPNISFDAPSHDEDGIDLKEKVASDFNIENKIQENSYINIDEILEDCSPEMKDFLNNILSKLQRKVLELLMNDYSKEKIMETLKIDSALYSDSIAAITSNKNTRNLRKALEEKKNVR